MSGPLLERIPPQSLEAEQAVLGAMMVEREAILRVADVLHSDDFYSPQHQKLYSAIADLFAESKPVDIVTVQARLQDRDELEACGGTPYLIELQEAAPTAAAVEHYGAIVREKALLRALIRAGGEIQEIARDAGDEDVQAVIGRCQRLLALDSGGNGVWQRWRDVMGETITELQAQLDSDRHTLGVPSGIGSLDAILSGWQRGVYYIVAARPSIGKTAFALAQTMDAATQGQRVAFFSLEMTAQAMARRHLARELSIDLQVLTNARFERNRLEEIVRVSARTQDWHCYICQRSDLRIGQLRAEARHLARRIGALDLIVVDYLQLLSPDMRGRNRNDELSGISAGLKALAMELDCSVMVLSQLNRDSEKERRMPRLSDLRDSGSIEQDADVVLLMSWPYWLPQYVEAGKPNKKLRRLDVAKQRNGPVGWFDVSWEGAYQRFAELERDRDEAGGKEYWQRED